MSVCAVYAHNEIARGELMSPMDKAIELSREKMAANEGGPFGAVIAKGDQIIAEGWNCVTSCNDPTAHAEVQAIRSACEKLKTFSLQGYDIYTSCEPCPMCLSAIYWAHLDNIYYANSREDAAKINFDDEMIYGEVAAPIEKRKIPMKQIGRDKALEVFKEWAAKEDKTPY